MATLPNVNDYRKADHPVEPIFVRRWSPRAMSGEPLSDAELMSLFEAARWAPSSFNEQPWRFLYARRDTPAWPVFLDLLVEGNRAWCGRAAVLIVVVGHKVFTRNGSPNPVAIYDCGSAWENLALQGSHMGLVVHGMAGFNFNKARTALHVPDDFEVAAMAAIGRPGDPDLLPEPLRTKEIPSGRRPVGDIALEGGFK
jgi:nitroreductase